MPLAVCCQDAFTSVARMRSVVSGSVVYRSLTNPPNSEPAVFSSTRPRSPLSMVAVRPPIVTAAVLVSPPDLANECPVPPTASQPYSSMLTRAVLMAGCEVTKCVASRTAKSSISPTPCSAANAYTVFFCASVLSTAELSPVRCVAARSPDSVIVTFRSRSRCASAPAASLSRQTLSSRTSALPYWLSARTIMSASPVGRVAERAEQQRHVVVLGRVGHGERDRHLRVERGNAAGTEVVRGTEGEPVAAPAEVADGRPQPTVGIG